MHLLGHAPRLLLPLVDDAQGVVRRVDLAVHFAADDALERHRAAQLVPESVDRETGLREPLREFLVRRDVVLLLEPLDLVLDLGVRRDEVELLGAVLEERLVHELLHDALLHLLALRGAGRGAGLVNGLIEPRVELALRDDPRVHVHEDAVDDLAGPKRPGGENGGKSRGKENDGKEDTGEPV